MSTEKQYLPMTLEQFLIEQKRVKKNVGQGQGKVQIKSQVEAEKNVNNEKSMDVRKSFKKFHEVIDYEDDEDQLRCKDIKIMEKVTYSEYDRKFKQMADSKFENMIKKANKQIENLRRQSLSGGLDLQKVLTNLRIQSNENVQKLKYELSDFNRKRNLNLVDSMLNFNKFFIVMNAKKRKQIYNHCSMVQFEEGVEIYKQGDVEDYMYVIVKGSVKESEKKTSSYQGKTIFQFTSHYEGSSFGEGELMSESTQRERRRHSIITCEKTYLLKIEIFFYKELMVNSEEDDFQKKINSLLSTTMFQGTSKIFVTPILSSLEKIFLSFGETLIKQGQEVRKLYFVADGSLKLVYINRQKRNVKHLNLEEKPKEFYTSVPKQKEKKHSIHSTFYYQKDDYQSKKQFPCGKKKVQGDELFYNDHIVFEEYRSGSFVGGKSFINSEQLFAQSQKSVHFTPSLQARISVIASSPGTVVFSLDENKFFSLPENVQKVITQGILQVQYFDERDIENKIQYNQDWNKYSEMLVAKVITEKKRRNQSLR